jgi:UDP-glucose 4-epimerase
LRALVTGGAGFIGSHLTRALLERGDEVTVLDDLSSGFRANLADGASFVHGGIEDEAVVRGAMQGSDVVFHEAATRGVLRSVEDPIGTDRVNTKGTLNILLAARDSGVRRVVVASSSSVYGGLAPLPTIEDAPLIPKSPYAVSKVAAEHYARVFAELYELETLSLRYFNVFGPHQRPESQYAAVIPLFLKALQDGDRPVVHGDGGQSRDFTYISNVVSANLLAAEADARRVAGRVYNVACGGRFSVLELLGQLALIMDVTPDPVFVEARAGDVRDSCADITAATRDLGYQPKVGFTEGLRATVEWFQKHQRG